MHFAIQRCQYSTVCVNSRFASCSFRPIWSDAALSSLVQFEARALLLFERELAPDAVGDLLDRIVGRQREVQLRRQKPRPAVHDFDRVRIAAIVECREALHAKLHPAADHFHLPDRAREIRWSSRGAPTGM